MKNKKVERKLTFNKKTIAHLSIDQLSNVKGREDPIIGDTTPTKGCPSCIWHIIFGCI